MATILVVDDRPVNRELLVTLLGYSGHRLLEAADGETALTLARLERPDLMIADIVMPSMDGYELARQVRADPLISTTQIVFYTSSYAVNETRQLAKACGVSHIIIKPAEPEAILEIVNAALNSPPPPLAPPVPDEFHREHMRLLTDTLVRKVEELEAEVAERKLAEERLRQSEARFRALIENAPDAIVLLNPEGRIIYLSPSTQRILGYAAEEALGLNPETLTHPDDLPALLALLDSLEQLPGQSVSALYRLRHKNGSWRWIEGTITNLLAEPGVNATVFNFKDVTDRKQAQTQLEFQAHILKYIHDAVVATDAQFGIISWNPASEAMYGWSAGEVLGRNVNVVLRTEMTETQLEDAIRHLQQAGSYRSEVIQHKKDGQPVHIEGNTITLTDEPGHITGYVTVNRDITQRKQAEDNLKAQKEILQKIFDHVPVMINFMDDHGRVLLINRQWEQVLGWSMEDTQNLDILAAAYPDPESYRQVMDFFARADGYWEEFKTRVKDGRLVDTTWALVRLTDGTIIGIGQDITERKRSEELLADALAFNQTIINSSPTGIITYKASGQAVSANVAVTHLIGATLEQVQAQNFRELKSWKEAGLLALAEQALASNAVQEADVHFVSSFGKEVWLSARFAPFRFHDELHLMGLFVDIAERKRSEAQIHRQVDRLAALRSIDTAITSSFDLRITLRILLDEVISQLGAHAAAILQYRTYLNRLEYIVGRGFTGAALERLRVKIGESLAGQVALGRQILKLPYLPASGLNSPELTFLEPEGFVSYYGLPLIAKGNTKGVLEIFFRTDFVADQDWLNFAEALTGQAAIAIDNAELFEGMQRTNLDLALAYDATIEGWSKALDLRDKETEGHTQRVTELTIRLARLMNFPEEDIVHLRRGALLHDIGKMGIPDAILLKPDKLTEEEWVVMRLHPVYAYEMLSPISYLRQALDIPYCHHEKWDGTGYPRGLKGEEIPWAARIFSVVDVWDALRSNRPYRAGWPEARVHQYINESVGTQFDPQVAEVFLRKLTGSLQTD